MKEMTTYEFFGKEIELTAAELDWFHSVTNKCVDATSCPVKVYAFNHDLYDGKSKDALGCCVTTNRMNPLEGDTYITIDTWFIHEKFEEVFNDFPMIEKDSLESVLAHEIAHLYSWRHGKKHNRITAELLEKIQHAA